MAGLQTSQWEDLHKQSRRLKFEIDLKLESFAKLGSSYAHRDTAPEGQAMGGSGHMFETMELEIAQLLAKLRGVIDALNEYVSSRSFMQTFPALWRIKTLNEILQLNTQEFNIIKHNIQVQRQREELLGKSKKEYKTSSGLNRRTELYLKENEHIRSTDKLTEDAISIAIATKENLSHQRNKRLGNQRCTPMWCCLLTWQIWQIFWQLFMNSDQLTTLEEIKPVPSDDQEFLKAFDLNYDYGPVVGLTRLERWERAKNFGLNPDQRVKDLIQQHPTDPKYTQCLWDDTLLGSSSS